jgi:hypothetical protein
MAHGFRVFKASWQAGCNGADVAHILVSRKQREGKGPVPGITFKEMPPVTYFLLLGPPPKVSTTSQNSANSWGPSVQV